MISNTRLNTLLRDRADIWRGGEASPHARESTFPTGHAELDERIGGWPRGALTELLSDQQGIGEVSLFLPALARLSGRDWIAWVDPPHIPYAPALAAAGVALDHLLWIRAGNEREGLWAMEQALRSGTCVLGWPGRPDTRALRRLQLAAEEGDTLGVLFRPSSAARQSSPAALRLHLTVEAQGATVRLLKRRGGGAGAAVCLGGRL